MLTNGLPVIFWAFLLWIRGCHSSQRSCCNCTYIQTVGTMGNYVSCVSVIDPRDLPTMPCDNFCVTIRTQIEENVVSFKRTCHPVDLGNSCTMNDDGTKSCYTSCLPDRCNKHTGNPFLDRNEPTGPYIQCYNCLYNRATGKNDDRCSSRPESLNSLITCPGDSYCVTVATFSQSKKLLQFRRGCSQTDAGNNCTSDTKGERKCTTTCTGNLCNGQTYRERSKR